jgi:GT2 family glycosyltransferase
VSRRILFVAANFNGAQHTTALLSSLMRLSGQNNLDIVIADDASTDDSVEKLGRTVSNLSNVSLFRSEVWRGYLGVAQSALDSWFAQTQAIPDWVILSNNDVLIEDEAFFSRLLLHDPDSVGVVAPATLSLRTQLNQNPFMRRRPRRFRLWQLKMWLSNYYAAALREVLSRNVVEPLRRQWRERSGRLLGIRRPEDAGPSRIYAPHGAFLIFSRQFFLKGGRFDSSCGLYGEELIIAETCRRLDLPILYDPRLLVHHNEHSTVGQRFSRTMYGFHKRALAHVCSQYLADIS